MAKEEIVTKVKEVMNAPSCYSGLKKVCQSYLDAAGTADEEKASALLKKELKEDVNSIKRGCCIFWRRYCQKSGKGCP